jgi:hydroxymethylbilane synthase
VTAEREFLRTLEGGCQVPIGANATLHGDTLKLDGMVGSIDGKVIFRESLSGKSDEAESIGTRLANRLIELGARELLDQAREQMARITEVI